jgi:hypothetical protein
MIGIFDSVSCEHDGVFDSADCKRDGALDSVSCKHDDSSVVCIERMMDHS